MPRIIRPQLLGARELVDVFQRLAGAVKTEFIERSLQAGAEVILESELAKAPVSTGKLRSEITLSTESVTEDRIVKTLTIGANAFYWRFLEFGTHWRRGAQGLRHAGKLAPGDYKMRPHPFARQAFTNRKTTATQTIRDTFRDEVLGFQP